MKLKDVKERIDNFFDNISAEKLYEVSVLKYGFSEITVDLENKHFETAKISYYSSSIRFIFNDEKTKLDCNLALAA
ncbi:hypothetical protein [Cloacibacterium caeni]|jgi:hypothetical protein|uniref:hypothetical protein n=1 Tax=Cloacibacterium caeni TaxID=2004710 RepID=UPI001BCC46DD|nr:hypothetical protein [Cloacibacterium caeni]